MKESVYNEKMNVLRKRRNTAQNRITELKKEITEQEKCINKTEHDMLFLGMEYANLTTENTVEMIEEKVREIKNQLLKEDNKISEITNITTGGKYNED